MRVIPTPDPAPAAGAPVVRLERASVSLGGRPIVREVSVEVRAGEVVALMGANGSGKSTLVKAMVGLHPLSSGRVELFGTPLESFSSWERLGYVPQRSPMTQGVPSSVAEVVAAGRLSRRRALRPPTRADRRAVARALEAVGLADRAGHEVATLSGGQQQRVLMARTLAGEPDVLVLDEPNAGVDQANQHAIAGTLARLAAEGATIVVVLHELGPFADLIQRCVVLDAGRVVADAPGAAPLAEGHAHHHDLPGHRLLRPQVRAPLEEGPR